MRQSWQLVGLILSFGACILIFPSVEVVQLTTLLSLNNANDKYRQRIDLHHGDETAKAKYFYNGLS